MKQGIKLAAIFTLTDRYQSCFNLFIDLKLILTCLHDAWTDGCQQHHTCISFCTEYIHHYSACHLTHLVDISPLLKKEC